MEEEEEEEGEEEGEASDEGEETEEEEEEEEEDDGSDDGAKAEKARNGPLKQLVEMEELQARISDRLRDIQAENDMRPQARTKGAGPSMKVRREQRYGRVAEDSVMD